MFFIDRVLNIAHLYKFYSRQDTFRRCLVDRKVYENKQFRAAKINSYFILYHTSCTVKFKA